MQRQHSREVVVGSVMLGCMGGLFGVVYVFEPAHVLTFLGTAITVGGTVGAPLLERLT